MPLEVIMPKLGLTMQEGIITRWIKKEGESVKKDEPLFEVETEKVNYEINSPATGILSKILFPEETSAVPGEVIALIEEQAEAVDEVPPAVFEPEKAKDVIEAGLGDKIAPDGRDEEYRIIPLQGMRKTICDRMHQSMKDTAQMTHAVEVDVTELVKARDSIKEKFKASFNDMIIKVSAEVLKKRSLMNSSLKGDEIHIFKKINIGMAVSVPNGLIVPVIKNVGEKSLREIASETNELAQKAQASKLTREEISEGTFTVTNLGMYGVDIFTPIINPPETAILGIGRIIEKPAVFNGEITKRKMMFLSLTFDHRIIDGAPAAEFLRDMQKAIEDPENLAE